MFCRGSCQEGHLSSLRLWQHGDTTSPRAEQPSASHQALGPPEAPRDGSARGELCPRGRAGLWGLSPHAALGSPATTALQQLLSARSWRVLPRCPGPLCQPPLRGHSSPSPRAALGENHPQHNPGARWGDNCSCSKASGERCQSSGGRFSAREQGCEFSYHFHRGTAALFTPCSPSAP